MRTADVEPEVAPLRAETVGVYVHIPFCERVCPYCDFAVEAVGRGAIEVEQEDAYVAALLAELELRAEAFAGRRLASLYFGGGTPALLRPDSLARLHETIAARFGAAPGSEPVEVTLEVNPSSVERSHLAAFRSEAGVNRLSVGVQSFDDSLLKALGRAHRGEACHSTLAAARAAGFTNVSIDLLFAALHQTRQMLEDDLEACRAFGPEHVSTYELVFEPNTPFGRASRAGKLVAYDEDASAELVALLETRLAGIGIERYELTNFARRGFESVHNRRYWQRAPVLGLGVGAHSSDPACPEHPFGARPANPRSRSMYLERVLAGGPVAESVDAPDREAAIGEAFFLALRCRSGLSAAAFSAEFGAAPRALRGDAIESLVGRGWLVETADGDLRLTGAGRQLADGVFTELI
jgi:oxygen-independent coproporphyrinogen-3 oxidase